MKQYNKKLLISFFLILTVLGFQISQARAETTTLTLSVGISELTTDNTYEKQVSTSITYNVSALGTLNVSDVVLRVYVQKSAAVLVLATTDISRTSIVNNTIYTETAVLKIDEQSTAGKELVDSDTLVIYAKLYNSSVSSANLLGSTSKTLDYGNLVTESTTTESTTDKVITYAVYIVLIIGGLTSVVLIYLLVMKGKEMLD